MKQAISPSFAGLNHQQYLDTDYVIQARKHKEVHYHLRDIPSGNLT